LVKQLTAKIKGISFYVKSNVDTLLTISINGGSKQVDFGVINSNLFVPVQIMLDFAEITDISIVVTENYTSQAIVYIDRVHVSVHGNRHDDFKIKKTAYKLNNTGYSMAMETGVKQPKLEGFISGLIAQSEELNFTGENV